MKKWLKLIITHPIFSSSFILVAGTNGINAINYLYHLVMGRLLGPVSYGELSTLFSLISLLSVVPLSFGTVVVKFIASAKTKEEIGGYIHWFNRPVFVISSLIAIGVGLSSFWLTDYLHVSSWWVVTLVGLSFLFVLPSNFYRSVLQGLIKFHLMVSSIAIETSIKLIAGVVLVILGFGVDGAMVGFVLSVAVGLFFSSLFLKKYRHTGVKPPSHLKKVVSFSIPVLIQTAASTSMMSVDLVLVKHFFPEFDAGIYAAVSTLGKIVLFGTTPVSSAMFPIIASYKAQGKSYIKMFFVSLLLTGLACCGVLLLYLLFPDLVLNLLYGANYLSGVGLVVPYALFMALLSITGLFVSFYLSIDHKKVVVLPLLAAIGQVIGIELFHRNLFEVVMISLTMVTLLLAGLSVYLLVIIKKND